MDGIIIFIVLAALGGYCIGCGLTLRKTQAEVERVTDNFYKAQAEAQLACERADAGAERIKTANLIIQTLTDLSKRLSDGHNRVCEERDEALALVDTLERRLAKLERPC